MNDFALAGAAAVIQHSEHRRWPIVGDAERAAVMRVLDRGLLSGADAPESVGFEQEFASFVGANHALLTHCGTSALQLALMASGVRAGDHVVIPAYSFIATAHAVVHAGAIPIFVDVDPETGLIDVDATASAVTRRTRAIVPVHIHGCPADMDRLNALASHRRLLVIEDAAQAHGAEYRGSPVGALGTAGAFSLQSSKNLGAGEGGVLVTNDPLIAEAAHRLRNFGQDVPYAGRAPIDLARPLDGTRPLDAGTIGWMYRGNEMMAAFARAQLEQLKARTTQCRSNAALLTQALADLPGVIPAAVPEDVRSVHHKYRVRLDPVRAGVNLSPRAFRDIVVRALRAEGLEVVHWQTEVMPAHGAYRSRIGWGDGWPWSLDRETDFAQLYDPARFPNACALLESSLVLFSQSCPLIAQGEGVVRRYGEAFARVWENLPALERLAREMS